MGSERAPRTGGGQERTSHTQPLLRSTCRPPVTGRLRAKADGTQSSARLSHEQGRHIDVAAWMQHCAQTATAHRLTTATPGRSGA